MPSKQAQRGEKCKEEKEGLGDTRAQAPSLATSILGWHWEDLGFNPTSLPVDRTGAPRLDTHALSFSFTVACCPTRL